MQIKETCHCHSDMKKQMLELREKKQYAITHYLMCFDMISFNTKINYFKEMLVYLELVFVTKC